MNYIPIRKKDKILIVIRNIKRNSEDKQTIDDLRVCFTYQAMSAEDALSTGRHRILKDIEALGVGTKHIRFYSLIAEVIY